MKTRLLRKLRREASEYFRFTILEEPEYCAWAEVYSLGIPVYFTCDGMKGANRFVRLATNKYIQDRINELRQKQYYDKRRKKRVL